MPANFDYHALSVRIALLSFVSDYDQVLHSSAESKVLQIVHGYGSARHGGIIRKAFLEIFAFQSKNKGLTYSESEMFDVGYLIVTPIRPLCLITDPLVFHSISYSVIEQLNAAIARINCGDKLTANEISCGVKLTADERIVTLDPSAVRDLDRLHLPESK